MPLRDVVKEGAAGPPDECWEWRRARFKSGYGSVLAADGRNVYVHRLAFETHVRALHPDEHIDHLCRNRPCWNPAHLEAVSLAENNRRAAAAVTHCPRGHEYTPENMRPGRGRDCRQCHRDQERGRRRPHR